MRFPLQKICCCFNFGPHYRQEIFILLERELNCDFYFGDKTYGQIKKLDYSVFNRKINELRFKIIKKPFYFLKDQGKLSDLPYQKYIITGQPYNLSSWLLLIRNIINRKQTYIWNHGVYGKENWFQLFLKKAQVNLCSGYFLYGDYAKDLMIKNGISEKKLHVIYNSLKYSECLGIRKSLQKSKVYHNHFGNDMPNLIFIGRLTKVKKLHLLMETLSILKGRFNLIIVGNGDVKDDLIKLSKELELIENVWFYGACYKEVELAKLIYNADLCVSPGNIGLTAIHALSYGTPCITHNNFKNQMPEFEAIQDGITGSFFKENEVSSLTEVVSKWLEKYPRKSSEIEKNCLKMIDEKYNPLFQLKVIKEVLHENSSD